MSEPQSYSRVTLHAEKRYPWLVRKTTGRDSSGGGDLPISFAFRHRRDETSAKTSARAPKLSPYDSAVAYRCTLRSFRAKKKLKRTGNSFDGSAACSTTSPPSLFLVLDCSKVTHVFRLLKNISTTFW